MYERSAIVLERYFEKLFGFNKENNLRENYKNYIKLIEDTKQYIDIVEKEEEIIKDFDEVANEIGNIQRKHEKVNGELVRLQEARNELFNEISEKPEQLEQKMLKVENAINDCNEKEIELRKQYIENLAIFTERQETRTTYDRSKRQIEKTHMDLMEETIEEFNKIEIEDVENLQKFIAKDSNENIEELNNIMLKNGKQERVAFDERVIKSSIEARIEIAKKEAELYVNVYDKSKRLLTVLESGNLKLGRSEKIVRDTGVKLGFLALEKEYIFSFLDYERMTIMNGETEHKKLMKEAVENFENDIQQIENLYELIDRETVSKGTKKAYKELYNADYLEQIQNKEKKFENKIESSKIRKTSVINSNFWRIEGIKNIYYLFQQEVTEKLGRDLSEYGIVEETTEESVEDKKEESKYDSIFGKENPEEIDLDFEEEEKAKYADEEEEIKETKKKKEIIEDDFEDDEDDKYNEEDEDFDFDDNEEDEEDNYDDDYDDDEDYDDDDEDDDDDFDFDDDEEDEEDEEDEDFDFDDDEDDDDDFDFDDDEDDDEEDFIEEDYDDDYYEEIKEEEKPKAFREDDKKTDIIIEHQVQKSGKTKEEDKKGKKSSKDKGLINKLFKK